jgi:hypothetical protein
MSDGPRLHCMTEEAPSRRIRPAALMGTAAAGEFVLPCRLDETDLAADPGDRYSLFDDGGEVRLAPVEKALWRGQEVGFELIFAEQDLLTRTASTMRVAAERRGVIMTGHGRWQWPAVVQVLPGRAAGHTKAALVPENFLQCRSGDARATARSSSAAAPALRNAPMHTANVVLYSLIGFLTRAEYTVALRGICAQRLIQFRVLDIRQSRARSKAVGISEHVQVQAPTPLRVPADRKRVVGFGSYLKRMDAFTAEPEKLRALSEGPASP